MTRNSIKYFLFAASLIVFSACGCTKKRDLPPTDGTFNRYTEGEVMHSEILGTDITFSVYLPESYVREPQKRYPVVYMLHGLGDNSTSWNGKYLHANTRIDNLVAAGMSEMIYVYPSGFTSYYCNYYTGKYNYMDMFIQEFVPYIDKCFRTIPDAQHRGTVGYSMGGFGAMVLAEKNPDVFSCSAPLSMSFRTDAQYMSESQSGWDGQWGKIFGGIAQPGYGRLTDYYKQHCPFYQFVPENKETLSKVNWFFICGDDEEQLLIANDTLHVQLRSYGYDHEYRVVNGGHSSSVWNDALSEVLPYFDLKMNGNDRWPSCAYLGYEKQTPEFEADGAIKSVSYKEEAGGTAVYVCHNGMDSQSLKDVMSVLYSTNTKVKYVFLPCDLSKKDFDSWKAEYADTYPHEKEYAFAFNGAGATVWANSSSFSTMVFIDTEISPEIKADPEKKYLFVCTEQSDCYRDFDALYISCKRNGASFEYRVLDNSGNAGEDLLRCAARIKTYITY